MPDERALALLRSRPAVVLTGAGISTESGIPDYRGPGKPVRTPMTYQEFVSGPEAQQRYWARGFIGWARLGHAEPNAGHEALASWEASGYVDLLVTQNVDGLHEAAGSSNLVALHGRIAQVVCLTCRATTSRTAMQARLDAANPGWLERHADRLLRPDGDVDLDDTVGFAVPGCEDCGGPLKPDVVFFGENVPRTRVQRVVDAVDRAAVLLVVGSSLAVMSGFRFVRQAARAGIPVVIVNRGPTRGDALASYRIDEGCSEFLAALVRG